MFADTAAIGTVGTELSRLSADLDAVAAALPESAPACAVALGPVGAEFVTALAGALDATAQAVRLLGSQLGDAAGTAARTASAYTDAEHRAVVALGG